ncbi:hypothetical protein B0A55_09785 [Friedmanniomyces simplex]|uniref:CHY-type domain-containing protein n=1 Tax=Friedmanniomyces simplex TaxID=329884 RepID=A0A4U0WWV0_9PEZI|nr:hypothetical protein B0A55_09785 [Friedmanniomyces simplex]
MADTIKIVANKGPVAKPKEASADVATLPEHLTPQASQSPAPLPPSEDEIRVAESKRQQHTRQLEARFGRLQAFFKSSDGLTYTLPLDSPKRTTWPASLQGVRSVTLHVPRRYPIQAASIHLDVDSEEGRLVEDAISRLPETLHEPTLTQLANHLTQHLHEMAINKQPPTPQPLPPIEKGIPEILQQPKLDAPTVLAKNTVSDDKQHIHIIPRPPEWAQQQDDDDDDKSASESSSADDSSSDEAEAEFPQAEAEMNSGASAPQERGVLLSFPHAEIYGIELLELTSLNITVKCERCKDTMDVQRLRNAAGNGPEMRQETSFRIPEVKFLQVSASAIRASKAPGRKKAKENLGITAGSELPRRGRCKHYSKSYRWFRFSCCSKVFPCDRCHDEETDHPNEHANRMLCGYCSREQNFRPEDCGICHAVLIGKRGRGFWEGGKGTRDPTRMSKKDPRKYKRRPGTKPKT